MKTVFCVGKIMGGVLILTYVKYGKVVTESKILAPKQKIVRGLVS